MKLSSIKLNPDNPRQIKDARFEALKKSIFEFPKMLELRPIIIDNDGVILGGNMRYRALKELKYKEIPDNWVRKATDLTDEERRRFILTDNNEFGEWDFDTLSSWDEDELVEWGIDLTLTLDDLEKNNLTHTEFTDGVNNIKNEDATNPIVADYMENYNAFIIVTKNEIDENFVREYFGLNETTGNTKGLSNRKPNVIDIEDLRKKCLK